MDLPYLHTTAQRNIVLTYKRGPALTHFLGLDGCTLTVMKLPNTEFDRLYDSWEKNTPQEFAKRYLSTNRSSLIGLTGAAHRVLVSTINNSSSGVDDEFSTTSPKGMIMSTEETFRKPDGPVAQIHTFLDKKLEAIKAGTVSRKELIEQMEAKGYNASTIVTQCGVWARNNAVTFARPSSAEAAKKEAAAAKRQATKATKATKAPKA